MQPARFKLHAEERRLEGRQSDCKYLEFYPGKPGKPGSQKKVAPLVAVPVPAHISGSIRPAAQQPSPAADSECESERVLNGISAPF
jgi:hypothetical protein